MVLSVAQKILKSKRTVVLFHTWTVTKELLAQAIREKRSMDLDVCVDDSGNAYLGHSKEYHDKTHEPFFNSMPLWEAVEALSRSNIPVIVDCKHVDAWPVVESVVTELRPERCLVCSFASELKFDASRADGEPDFITEWSSIDSLREMKRSFPSITTTACAKWLPADVLTSDKYGTWLARIVSLLKENRVDTICLNVPDSTFSDRALALFLREGILTHVGVDHADVTRLSHVYIGETDTLELASRGALF
ncbi:MAG TPA: hypothetical protein VFU86_10515 [Terriglobales bacterium]|nr:hypothetical protein [Terriglobales bacterium]